MFYERLLFIGSLYLLAFPIVFMIADNIVVPYYRHRVITISNQDFFNHQQLYWFNTSQFSCLHMFSPQKKLSTVRLIKVGEYLLDFYDINEYKLYI